MAKHARPAPTVEMITTSIAPEPETDRAMELETQLVNVGNDFHAWRYETAILLEAYAAGEIGRHPLVAQMITGLHLSTTLDRVNADLNALRSFYTDTRTRFTS